MIIETSPHSKALAQLYPKTMDAEQNAVAIVFDGLLEDLDAAHLESSPSTASTTLERWEAVYDLAGDGTDEERWMAVRVAYAAQPGISATHYIALALAMGFVVEIPDPPKMFRADLSYAGEPVYDEDEQYTMEVWVCNAANATEAAALVAVFEREKIPFTVIRWVYDFEVHEDGTAEIDESGVLQLEESEEEE